MLNKLFSNEGKFWNWLIVSSEDPTKVATTVKGFVGLAISFGALFIHGTDFSNVPDDVYSIVVDLFTVVSAAAVTIGAIRKVWNTFFPPADTTPTQ